MSDDNAPGEYLVISRGQWDADKSPQEIQDAIDRFYVWHGEMVARGVMRSGQRLAREGKLVSRDRIVDGPFAEAKEVVGGFWFVRADSLEEAARISADNPCLACGLQYEIRPFENVRASAFAVTSETPERN
ncbi:YciI family protein [Hydrogenophaga sp.]|uniref:YciI family protein n=1 Tax=Hydrogenophaga sp. TaxID=1904254 RepID=UPI003F6EF358